jgi:AbrB family looped-hinge helix DNA binding protein
MAEREIISTVTSKGQVTIPAAVRKHLRLPVHGKVVFVIEEEGAVRLSVPRYPNLDSVRGAAGSLKEPMSWSDVQRIAQEDRLQSERADKP